MRVRSRPAATLILAIVLCSPLPIMAQAGPGEQSADTARIMQSIIELSGPRFAGRLTGSEGNLQAVRYLAQRLTSIGGRPLPGSEALLQWYGQPVLEAERPPQLRVTSGTGDALALQPGVDFDVLIRDGTRMAGEVDAPLLELTPERAREGWVRANRNAVLLMDATAMERFAADHELMAALFHPTHGPAAVAMVLPRRVTSLPRSLLLTATEYLDQGPFLIQLTHEAGDRLRRESPPRVTIRSYYRVTRTEVANLAALIRDGSGEGARDGATPVVITAHLDGPGAIAPDCRYPGAIDNASGVAVILEAARLIGERSPTAMERPVWVVLFNGEEQGLFGSQAFVSEHRDALVGADVVNVDMVGHDAGLPISVSVGPGGDSLANVVARLLGEAGLRVDVRETGGSDHASFGEATRAVSLVQSPYPHMHQQSDSADRARPELLTAVTEVVRRLVDSLSTADASSDRTESGLHEARHAQR